MTRLHLEGSGGAGVQTTSAASKEGEQRGYNDKRQCPHAHGVQEVVHGKQVIDEGNDVGTLFVELRNFKLKRTRKKAEVHSQQITTSKGEDEGVRE